MDSEVENELRRIHLVAYVAGFGGMSPEQAEQWLDANSPIGAAWRETPLPAAQRIEVEEQDEPE